MRTAIAFLALLLVPLPFALAPAGAQGAAPLPWWGPTEPSSGFHIRIPVTVTNGHDYPLTNAPVAAEVDVVAKLVQAGWVSTPAGGGSNLLKAFALDEASVRVVAMTNLDPPRGGSLDGQLLPVDPTQQGLKRFEVPSAVFHCPLREHTGCVFDATANPFITVVWRVPGTLQPGEARSFVVYLDTLTNGQHAPSPGNGTVLASSLSSLFWSGAGLTLYGQVTPTATQVAKVSVTALHDNTMVTVWRAMPGGGYEKVAPGGSNPPNPAPFAKALDRKELFVSNGAPTLFRVEADKPVLATVASSGFVPSTDGGLLGRDFYFTLTHTPDFRQDTVYFTVPTDRPTTAVVEPVPNPNGLSYTFNLASAADSGGNRNDFNYTIGGRAGTWSDQNAAAPCKPPSQPEGQAAALLPLTPQPQLYHARVKAGDPVLLQVQASDGLFPVPGRSGEPTSTQFLAATGWTEKAYVGGSNAYCAPNNRQGGWIGIGVADGAALRVTSPEHNPVQLDPPDAIGNPTPPAPRALPQGPPDASAGPFPTLGAADRPVFFSATEPVWLYAGLSPAVVAGGTPSPPYGPIYSQSAVPIVNGPLLGDAVARSFAGVGPVAVVAAFDGTRVDALLRCSGRLATPPAKSLAGGDVRTYTSSDCAAGEKLQGYRLLSNKPLFGYPTLGAASILAGVPAFLDATLHPAEFRGYLLKVSSPSGLDPLTGAVQAGASITYTVEVTNLGRGVGGANLPDTAVLSLTTPTQGWTATMTPSTPLTLQSGAKRTVTLTVTPGPQVQPNTYGSVSIQVASLGNPLVRDTLRTATLLKNNVGVGLWFDFVGNPRTSLTHVVTGPESVFHLWVKNLGSREDTVRLTVTPPSPKGLLLQGGAVVESVKLAAGQELPIDLRVALDAGEDQVDAIVKAASTNSPSAFVTLTASTEVQRPSDLGLAAPLPVRRALPGDHALFPLVLTNRGSGAANAQLTLQTDAPGGWQPATLAYRNPATGALSAITTIVVEAGQSVTVLADLPIPATAQANDGAVLRVGASTSQSPVAREAFLYGFALPLHRLTLNLPPLPLLPTVGGKQPFTILVRNQGNLDEVLAPQVANLPPGWTVDLPGTLAVAKDALEPLSGNLTVPAAAPAGLYEVALALAAPDGNRTLIRMPASLGTLGRGNVTAPDALLAQPGQEAVARFTVGADGNAPLTVTAQPLQGEPWAFRVLGAPLKLAPGAQGTVLVAWRVPANERDGNTTHRLDLVLTPDGGSATRQTTSSLVSVGRPDLTVTSAHAFRGAGGTLVQAVVRNLGDRPAANVQVALLAGAARLDNVTLGAIAPGTESNVTLLAPGSNLGQLAVSADPENQVVERSETNNLLAAGAASAQKSPAPAAALLVLLLGFLAQRRRRAA
ncbi:MAG: hypothetical protein QOG31_108 [Thermoplasmata archaeon]|jgi:uncharacterized membrane protein|nr:hypothetical protein [Thermoplasmata archaeon]